MEIVLDACSIINLINGDVLQKVILLNDKRFYVGEYLYDEEILDISQKLKVQTLVQNSCITLLQSTITLTQFSILKNKYDLGNGETECIAICKNTGYFIATDDKKARSNASTELGGAKVIGSLYLIRETVRENIITCESAKDSYQLMKQKGAFLPKIDFNYFCD